MTKVAVVNDDTMFLDLMAYLIEERGWAAMICRESDKAFQAIKEELPDLIILDIRMERPESGWTVLELLTLDPVTRDIPVVVCSAAVFDLREKEDWLNARGITILPKPFDINDLYHTVDSALRHDP